MRRLETKREAIAWIKEWHRRWRAESDASWAVTGDDGANLLGYVALCGVDLEFGFAEITYWGASTLSWSEDCDQRLLCGGRLGTRGPRPPPPRGPPFR
jgi:hypothetical protein